MRRYKKIHHKLRRPTDISSHGINCRNVPILLLDSDSELNQHPKRRKSIDLKASNPIERKISIPIQRIDDTREEDSNLLNKNGDAFNVSASNTESNGKENKSYAENIKQENASMTTSNVNIKPQKIVTVPIQIEITEDSKDNPGKTVLENKDVEPKYKASKKRMKNESRTN